MEANLENPAYRKKLITEINGTENEVRMENSVTEWQTYTGNIAPYVYDELKKRFSPETLKEMPIVSAVNVLRKVVNSRASLYTREPERIFTEVDDSQTEVINKVYEDALIDSVMLESNRLYELQKMQTHLLIEPKKGMLRVRPIKAHQVNVIPSHEDPEEGEIYIFSAFTSDVTTKGQDQVNQEIGDYDDMKAKEDRYIVWSKSYHFIMDGNGGIISEDIENPLGFVPIVEITAMKDFTYWRELTNDAAKFCIDYNVSLSMLGFICEMQGFAQAYLKSPSTLMPETVEIGPTRLLKLITDPNMEGDVEFGYANPNSDIASVQANNESTLAQFLSSQGLDSTTVSGAATADKYTSGVERLLAQIEKFEASKATMATFRAGEARLYDIIKGYLNFSRGSDILSPEYTISEISADSKVVVNYAEPQSVMSELEQLELAERKIELGIWDEIDAYADMNNLTREESTEAMSAKLTKEPKDNQESI